MSTIESACALRNGEDPAERRARPRGAGAREASALAWWVVAALFGSGLWAHLERALPLALGFLLLLAAACSRRGRELLDRPLDLRFPPFPERPVAALAVGVVCCFPVVAYLALTFRQEFPFVGDHSYELMASETALAFWSAVTPWLACAAAMLAWARWRLPGPWWPVAALLGLFVLSFFFEPPGEFARYPGGFYCLASPLYWWAKAARWDAPLNALRIANAAAVPAWLLLLRPILAKRWPDAAALLFSLFFFWQKDVVYYFGSSYLEPWCVVLVVLAVELRVSRSQNAVLAPLLVGAASLVKEQAILLLPWIWLGWAVDVWKGGGGRPLQRVARLTITACAAGMPFLAYFVFRRHTAVWRQVHALPFESVLSTERLAVFARRLEVQFGGPGLVLLASVLFVLMASSLRGKRRFEHALILAGVMSQVAFFYADAVSVPWTGYPRFHLIALALIGGVAFGTSAGAARRERRRAMALAVMVAACNAPGLVRAAELTLGPDPGRNFVEHVDAPVYFPIAAMVREADARHLLTGVHSIVVNTSSLDYWLPPALPIAYPALARRYAFRFAKDACACHGEGEAVLFPIVYRTGLGTIAPWRERLGEQQCLESLRQSCRDFMVRHMPDGTPTGALGVRAK